jgi:hypothetical protein
MLLLTTSDSQLMAKKEKELVSIIVPFWMKILNDIVCKLKWTWIQVDSNLHLIEFLKINWSWIQLKSIQ